MVATHGWARRGTSGEQVGHEVGAASLPGRAGEHRSDGVLEPLMRIGGHQFHPAQAPGRQRTQERQPERAVLARPHVDAQHLPLPFAIDPGGHRDAHVDDPPVLTDLLGQRIQPQVGIGPAVQGTAEEGVDHGVQLGADARDLALGDALAAKRLHEVLDAAGGDALHVGLLHDGEQGALAAPAGFEQGGEVAALPHLRDLQLQVPTRVSQGRAR